MLAASGGDWAAALRQRNTFCAAYSSWTVSATQEVGSPLLEEAARWAACRRTPPTAQTNAYLRAAFFARLLARLGVSGPYVELGVRRGEFSGHLLQYLRRLRNATLALPRLFLVDTWQHWAPSDFYVDGSNVDGSEQQANLRETLSNIARFWPRVSVLQLTTSEAAPVFRDGSLGFVYIDARHDYCAVREDLALYWPKLAAGGILAGDDYGKLEWPWCQNGSRIEGGLDLAVQEFAKENGLRLMVVQEQWLVHRPFVSEDLQTQWESSHLK